jgi:hypothetical protein
MFNISDVVTQSLKLAWRHKILWVFALIIGAGASGNMNFNLGGGSGSQKNDRYEQQQETNITVTSTSESKVNTIPTYYLDESLILRQDSEIQNQYPVQFSQPPNFEHAIVAAWEDFVGVSGSIWQEVRARYLPHTILIILSFALIWIAGLAFSIILRSWAQGAFLNGVDQAIADKSYSLPMLGTFGRIHVKEVVKYNIFITVIGISMSLLGLSAVLLSIASVLKTTAPFAIILLAGLGLFILGIIHVVLSYVSFYAYRYIAVLQVPFWAAFKNGLSAFKNYLGKAIILSVTNCAVYFVFGIATVLAVFIMIFTGGVGFGILSFIFDNDVVRWLFLSVVIILAGPALIALLLAVLSLKAYLSTYQNFTWSFLFNHIVGRNKEGSNEHRQ